LAELVEGTFLLRKQVDKNLLRWFESNTLRQEHIVILGGNMGTSDVLKAALEKKKQTNNFSGEI
jgi:hypothetical protein